jgi:hypothetical protein
LHYRPLPVVLLLGLASLATFGHGEMTVVIARSWWHVMVDVKIGRALRIVGVVVFWGSGEILVISTPKQ